MAFPPVPAAGTLQVQVETVWLPTFTVGLIEAGQGLAAGPALMTKLLKPKLTITSGGVRLGTLAPAGDPGPSKWPLLALGALALGGFLLARLFR